MREYSAGSIRQTFERKQYKHMIPGAEFLVLSISCSFQASPDWLMPHRQGGASVSAHAIGQRPHKCTNVTAETNFKRAFLKRTNSEFCPRNHVPTRTNHTKFCTARCPSVATPLHQRSPLHSTTEHSHIHPRDGGKNEHGNILATDQKTSNNVMREKKKN